MKMSQALPCLLLLFAIGLSAQTKTTRLRGTVQEAGTKKPIAGATVSASGDTAQQTEVTDDKGFFRLVIEGVAPGDIVRLRVVKTGYTVYDRQVVTTEELPITVNLHRAASAAASTPAASPAVSNDPVTARYIQELKTQNNPQIRLNALDVVLRSAAKDPAALAAVAAAVNDGDYRVRETAAYDLGKLGKPSPQALTALRIALDDPEPEVRNYAMDALGQLSSNKAARDILFDKMGAPPNVNLYAASVLNNFHIDDPRILKALLFEATVKNEKYAIDALSKDPLARPATPALFQALGTPPNVNISAMRILDRLHLDDPRLISALAYEATVKKDKDAITALSHYPGNKDAVEALFTTLGTPTATNVAALNVLCDMGIDDPRLSEALLANATTYKAPTVDLLLKKSPLPPGLAAETLQYISRTLDLPLNFRAQIYVNILLKAGGPAGRQALHHLLASSDAQHQGLLALAWLEVEHDAAHEILPDLHLPDTENYLVKLAKTAAQGTVALPDYDTSNALCNEGPSLRAIMGLALLNLAPKEHPATALIRNINSPLDSCAAYAAAAVAWLGPSILKAASSTLIHSARCDVDLSQVASTDTLALIGDEKTIAELQTTNNTYSPGSYICDGDPNHLGHLQDDLIVRIRKRLNGGT